MSVNYDVDTWGCPSDPATVSNAVDRARRGETVVDYTGRWAIRAVQMCADENDVLVDIEYDDELGQLIVRPGR